MIGEWARIWKETAVSCFRIAGETAENIERALVRNAGVRVDKPITDSNHSSVMFRWDCIYKTGAKLFE
jgi:hypothetical protein